MTDKYKIAEYFYQQCTGGYNGHMAEIPHNPTIKAFLGAMCKNTDRRAFAEFLQECANELMNFEEKTPF